MRFVREERRSFPGTIRKDREFKRIARLLWRSRTLSKSPKPEWPSQPLSKSATPLFPLSEKKRKKGRRKARSTSKTALFLKPAFCSKSGEYVGSGDRRSMGACRPPFRQCRFDIFEAGIEFLGQQDLQRFAKVRGFPQQSFYPNRTRFKGRDTWKIKTRNAYSIRAIWDKRGKGASESRTSPGTRRRASSSRTTRTCESPAHARRKVVSRERRLRCLDERLIPKSPKQSLSKRCRFRRYVNVFQKRRTVSLSLSLSLSLSRRETAPWVSLSSLREKARKTRHS